MRGRSSFQPALRRLVRDRDIFFLGTAIGGSSQGSSRCRRAPNGDMLSSTCPEQGFVFKSVPHVGQSPRQSGLHNGTMGRASEASSSTVCSRSIDPSRPVSYTHLTLPTIYSV